MQKSSLLLILLTLCAMVLLIWQAQNPVWLGHLRADSVIYQQRVCS